MSYDIYLTVEGVGDPEDHFEEIGWWNYTSNCAPMWRKAMPETDGLAGLHGMTAKAAAAHIEKGIAAMEADPDAYREMNPENGWGDFDSQLEFLRKIATRAKVIDNPTIKFEVSR